MIRILADIKEEQTCSGKGEERAATSKTSGVEAAEEV